jgi:hypothetical protein
VGAAARWGSGSVVRVEHRVDEQLPGEGDPVVTGEDRDGGGNSAASAVAHDGDACGIDAEIVGPFPQPCHSGEAVRRSRTCGCLGGGPVVDGEHGDAGPRHVRPDERVVERPNACLPPRA